MIKASAILAAALGLTFVLHRRSAAERHSILAAAIVSAALLPVLSFVLPSWEPRLAERVAAALPQVHRALAGPGPGRGSDVIFRAVGIESGAGDLDRIWFTTWLAGSILSLMVFATGVARQRWFACQSRPLSDPSLYKTAVDLACRLGCRRKIRLLQSGEPSMPMTWGVLRPAVLLPDGASGWPEERKRVVLAHELAHVYRADWFFQMAAQSACAVYCDDASKNSGKFKTRPWTVSVEGLVKKPAIYDLDDLIKGLTIEDRIYRMRCVERWSMVIPWRGFPLSALIKRLEPAPSAKYVEFKTILAKDQMPGQRDRFLGGGLNWPYREGLRMDEAMNPLSLIATGIYGRPLPNQNGAPLRLVAPWKYGFKSIKAIVTIRFTEKQPISSWMESWPEAYGFYANVNPAVDHPRWSQAREQRIGESRNIFFGEATRPTLMFNGYAEQVAHMYAGMDLRRNY